MPPISICYIISFKLLFISTLFYNMTKTNNKKNDDGKKTANKSSEDVITSKRSMKALRKKQANNNNSRQQIRKLPNAVSKSQLDKILRMMNKKLDKVTLNGMSRQDDKFIRGIKSQTSRAMAITGGFNATGKL